MLFDKKKNCIECRLRNYDFYPELLKGYQCYPECILLFDAITLYLNEFEKPQDQTPDSIISILKSIYINESCPQKESVFDMLFAEAVKKHPEAECITPYKIFKNSYLPKQKDAVSLLYQYFTFDRYLLKREEAWA